MKNILIVIVLYKCKLNESKTYNSLIGGRTDVNIFIYDNSPYSQEIHQSNVIYQHDPNNRGLSYAYNTAAKYAQNHKCKWILILDQDTTFENDALSKYIEAITKYPSISLFAPIHKISNGKYISPTKYFHRTSKPSDSVPKGIIPLLPYAPINSGMLIRLETFWQAGGYENSVWLDFSDIQFIEKIRKVIDSFYVIDTTCIQDFSVLNSDIEKQKRRFQIFCQCARACKHESIKDHIDYLYVTVKRCISLVIKNKSLSFISIYLNNYFKSNSCK